MNTLDKLKRNKRLHEQRNKNIVYIKLITCLTRHFKLFLTVCKTFIFQISTRLYHITKKERLKPFLQKQYMCAGTKRDERLGQSIRVYGIDHRIYLERQLQIIKRTLI